MFEQPCQLFLPTHIYRKDCGLEIIRVPSVEHPTTSLLRFYVVKNMVGHSGKGHTKVKVISIVTGSQKWMTSKGWIVNCWVKNDCKTCEVVLVFWHGYRVSLKQMSWLYEKWMWLEQVSEFLWCVLQAILILWFKLTSMLRLDLFFMFCNHLDL